MMHRQISYRECLIYLTAVMTFSSDYTGIYHYWVELVSWHVHLGIMDLSIFNIKYKQ